MPQLRQLIYAAFDARIEFLKVLEAEQTDCYRLFHGVNEGRPGLTIDRYGSQVLIQTFRGTLTEEEIHEIKNTLSELLPFEPSFTYNDRYNDRGEKKVNHILQCPPSTCKEMGVQYKVNAAHGGQDPLLFPDLRPARRYVKEYFEKKENGSSMLNLFAYTCGAGLTAAVAGAKEVWNIDFTQSYLDFGKENAALNQLPGHLTRFIKEDVFAAVRQLAGLGVKGKARRRKFMHFKPRQFDMVFLDPPTIANSPFGKVDIINDYQALFKPTLLCVKPGGVIIATNHAPQVELQEWLTLLQRCAQKAGREISDLQVIPPDPDFPSPDQKFPLKTAAITC